MPWGAVAHGLCSTPRAVALRGCALHSLPAPAGPAVLRWVPSAASVSAARDRREASPGLRGERRRSSTWLLQPLAATAQNAHARNRKLPRAQAPALVALPRRTKPACLRTLSARRALVKQTPLPAALSIGHLWTPAGGASGPAERGASSGGTLRQLSARSCTAGRCTIGAAAGAAAT